MLRLAQDRGELNVVDDQLATPTSAGSIAKVCAELIDSGGLSKLPSGT
jgi:dTDP-4-dehydrorhamnose reductase